MHQDVMQIEKLLVKRLKVKVKEQEMMRTKKSGGLKVQCCDHIPGL